MKLLRLLQEIRLLEKNKTVDFFRKNPDKLKAFRNIPSANANWEYDWESRSDRGDARRKLDFDVYYSAIAKLDPSNKFAQNLQSSLRYGSLDNFFWYVNKLQTYDEFRKYNDTDYSFRTHTDEVDWADWADHEFMAKHYNAIRKIAKSFIDRKEGLKDLDDRRFEKDMMKLGLEPRSVRAAMDWVEYYTAGSYRKLPKDVFDTLQQMSVDASRLPKYIYRGFFFDGAKIKDREKFLTKWREGSMPRAGLNKATSWSGDKGTAVAFMDAQDRVKDSKTGFHVLLKWKVNADDVIADLRNMPGDFRFWNQHEFIISPDVKDYVVDKIIPYQSSADQPYDTLDLVQFRNAIKGGHGGMGRRKGSTLSNFLFSPYDKFGTNEKIAYKQLLKMSVKDVKSKLNVSLGYNTEYSNRLNDALFPLAAVLRLIEEKGWQRRSGHQFNIDVDKVISPYEIRIKFEFKFTRDYSTNSFNIEDIFPGGAKYINLKYPDAKFDAENVQVGPVAYGTISMNKDFGIYNIAITLDVPNKFKIDSIETNEYIRNTEINDKIMTELFDKFGDKKIVSELDKTMSDIKSKMPSTVKLTLK
jgi:hypothetical protein